MHTLRKSSSFQEYVSTHIGELVAHSGSHCGRKIHTFWGEFVGSGVLPRLTKSFVSVLKFGQTLWNKFMHSGTTIIKSPLQTGYSTRRTCFAHYFLPNDVPSRGARKWNEKQYNTSLLKCIICWLSLSKLTRHVYLRITLQFIDNHTTNYSFRRGEEKKRNNAEKSSCR